MHSRTSGAFTYPTEAVRLLVCAISSDYFMFCCVLGDSLSSVFRPPGASPIRESKRDRYTEYSRSYNMIDEDQKTTNLRETRLYERNRK